MLCSGVVVRTAGAQMLLPLAVGLEPHLPGSPLAPFQHTMTDSLSRDDTFNSAKPPGRLSLQERIFEKKPDEVRSSGNDKKTLPFLSVFCTPHTGTSPLVAYFVLLPNILDL